MYKAAQKTKRGNSIPAVTPIVDIDVIPAEPKVKPDIHGRKWSAVERVVGQHRLSDTDCDLLKKSFQELEFNLTYSGISILMRLLQQLPDYKTLWPCFRGIPDSALMGSEGMRDAACRFMTGMQVAVHSLQNEDANILHKELIRIADQHHQHRVHPTHLKEMLPMVLEVLDTRSTDIDTAWSRFFDLLVAVSQAHHDLH